MNLFAIIADLGFIVIACVAGAIYHKWVMTKVISDTKVAVEKTVAQGGSLCHSQSGQPTASPVIPLDIPKGGP